MAIDVKTLETLDRLVRYQRHQTGRRWTRAAVVRLLVEQAARARNLKGINDGKKIKNV